MKSINHVNSINNIQNKNLNSLQILKKTPTYHIDFLNGYVVCCSSCLTYTK